MTPSQTTGVRFFNGIPLSVPNSVYDGDGFYISHKASPRDYGCETTALVLGQGEKFYILKGDHREGYAPLLALGWGACLDYYKARPELMHEYSDRLPADAS